MKKLSGMENNPIYFRYTHLKNQKYCYNLNLCKKKIINALLIRKVFIVRKMI